MSQASKPNQDLGNNPYRSRVRDLPLDRARRLCTGFGTRRLKAILTTDPGTRVAAKMLMLVPDNNSSGGSSPTAEEIAREAPGVQRSTAEAFLQGAERFRAFLQDNGMQCRRASAEHLLKDRHGDAAASPPARGDGQDIVVAFSGFRDEELERRVEWAGGRVTGSVSGHTTAVVVPDGDEGTKPTTKTKVAAANDVPLVKRSQFDDFLCAGGPRTWSPRAACGC